MDDPPFEEGGVKEMSKNVPPLVATERPVGAPGTVAGVTESEAADGTESPTLFVATTVNV